MPAGALGSRRSRETRSRSLRGPEVLVGLAVLFNLWTLREQRLVVAYPNDLAFHRKMVWTATQLLSHGQSPLTHWFPHLSLGSPLFVQYQSASAVLTGALGLAIGAPQATAWSLYLLLALWPLSIYWTGRLLGWGRWESAVAAAISPLLFTVNSTGAARGFEAQAYVWLGSGLWSQLWAMWALPLALGFGWRYLSERRYLLGAVVALSLTIAFHYLTGYLGALIILVIVFLKPSDVLGRLKRAAIIFACSALATLWVTIPLLVDAKWTALNEFQVGTAIDDSYGAPRILHWLFTGAIFDSGRLPVVTVLAAIGFAACIARLGRDERARVLVAMFVLSLLLYFGRHTLGVAVDVLPGSRVLLFKRFIEGVQLAGIFLAAVGAVFVGRLVVLGARHAWPGLVRSYGSRRRVAIGGVLAIAMLIGVLSPAWTQLSAYGERNGYWIARQRAVDATQGTQLLGLIHLAERRGGGRIYAGLPSNWGYNFLVGGVQVYNYVEDTGADAMGLTLRTFSLMTNPEAYFDEDLLGDYAAFGVHYILAPRELEEVVNGRLMRVPFHLPVPATLLRRAGNFELWSVGTGGLIQVVDTTAGIAANGSDLGKATSGFLEGPLPGEGIFPTIAYAGQPAALPTLSTGSMPKGSPGTVVTEDDNLASGVATAVVRTTRTAVVLLKVSFDPGWSASVDAKRIATEMIAPALVGVRVTRGVHTIEFRFHGFGSYPVLFGVAVVTVVAVGLQPAVWRRRRQRTRAS